MNLMNVLAGLIALVLLVYLFIALLAPEKFE
jgi:K+-transporting ATPase KdpF subunit